MTITYSGGAVLQFAALSHQGLVRSNNEDSLAFEPETGFAVVADGVGGNLGGEVASSITAGMMQKQVRQRLLALGGESLGVSVLALDDCRLVLRSAFVDAHLAVAMQSTQDRKLRGMATTATSILVHGHTAIVCWVGDSPAFLLRSGKLEILSRSQNLGEMIGRDAAGGNADTLMSVVGSAGEPLDIDSEVRTVQDGDLFLLCTDGLTNMVHNISEINSVLSDRGSLEDKAQSLIDRALAGGGKDNVSVVLVKVVKAGRAHPESPGAVAGMTPERHSFKTWTWAGAAALLGCGVGYATSLGDPSPRQVVELRQQIENKNHDMARAQAEARKLESDLKKAQQASESARTACSAETMVVSEELKTCKEKQLKPPAESKEKQAKSAEKKSSPKARSTETP